MVVNDRGEPAIGRGSSRRNLVSGGFAWNPNHDAVMRIEGEAPGGGPVLHRGIEAIDQRGTPPPRIVAGSSSVSGSNPKQLEHEKDAIPAPSRAPSTVCNRAGRDPLDVGFRDDGVSAFWAVGREADHFAQERHVGILLQQLAKRDLTRWLRMCYIKSNRGTSEALDVKGGRG